KLSLAIINRRPNKIDSSKSVFEKVTFIKDINIKSPHRAHIEILFELSFSEVQRKFEPKNFIAFHEGWQSVLSIKELNKRFYRELSDWYFWAMREVFFPEAPLEAEFGKDAIDNPVVREHNAKNLIRLLTRILFVWFVKEKGLIPEELFDKDFVQENLIKEFLPKKFNQKTQSSSYYRAILQNLFFATLNQDKKREFRNPKPGQHMNVTNLMRYESYFKDPQKFIELVDKTVPFMNGGLFECLDKPHDSLKGIKGGDKIVYIDGFSDRPDNRLMVPDHIFFGKQDHVDLSEDYGQEKGKNKNVTVRGLIDILHSYKFTIAENTPIDEDIALDPELLGQVFENLLASYNPETKTTARKQTGSFYTPREIVDYMVDESLIAHLKNSLSSIISVEKELDEKLHLLLSYLDEQPFQTDKEKDTIIKSLDDCKILDPACGSGAFPMGVLHKMVHILHKVDPKNEKWKNRQLEKVEAIDDDSIRENAIEDIEEAFENNDLDYGRKLYLIENGMYGVDIQPIAVQISKLRFFISLIVDQHVNKKKKNFGVRPLPNLETKFVAANTLIGIKKPEEQGHLFEDKIIKDLEKKLKDVRHRLFSAKTQKTKKKLRDEDKDLRETIGERLIKNGWGNDTAKQLASWDPYNQNSISPFFDSEWMFDVSEGFDIVIGNPPYVQLQKDGGKLAKMYANEGYETFARTGDIYSLFYEMGIWLLTEKGYLCFITSNKWMRADYGKHTRKYFAENTHPLLLIDFGQHQVFENATVDTNILLLTPVGTDCNPSLRATRIESDFKIGMNIHEYLKKNSVPLANLSGEAWVIGNPIQMKIKQKVEAQGIKLKDWDIQIYRGILTGYNEAFIIDGKTKDELIKKDKKNAEILKPLLRGRDIKRWTPEFADLWLIATFPSLKIKIDDYPDIKKYLLSFGKKRLEQSGETGARKKTGNKWFETQDQIGYWKEFEKPKIVWGNLNINATFSYSDNHDFTIAPCNLLTSNEGKLKYLLALLNSSMTSYLMRQIGYSREQGYLEYKKIFVEQLPIPKPSPQQEVVFETLVDCILFIYENFNKEEHYKYVSKYESVIDALVLDLYFAEEIKKAGCYILDRAIEKIKPFREDDTGEFKRQYIQKLYEFFIKDKVFYHGIIYRRNIDIVKAIYGENKDGG
ncbi:MAG: Eco57I restriction-modification methylase domain-containing protein, partial [Leptospiraceae bacterium]|nr:Eco57I restriction-modification methylase domain-containing protein [Leptospiraceae bacterium]